MFRPTLASARASSLPASIGLCAADISAIAVAVNEAQEVLVTDPLAPDTGWWGGWSRMGFTVQPSHRNAYITTPRDIARLTDIDVCNHPIHIRNGFYEFLEFGAGLKPNCCKGSCQQGTQAFERDSVVTLTDLITTAPQTIRLYPTDPADTGKRFLIQGKDQNGMPVTSVDNITKQTISGENVYLTFPFVDTVNEFTVITGISKEQTIGQVQIFQVDDETGAENPLSNMDPGETTASYRRYFLNGLPCRCCNSPTGQVQVTAQAKLDFVPVQSDADYLIIQSIPAVIEEVQARRYSRMDSKLAASQEQKHHAKALSILFGQLDHYLGKTNTAISVPLFGSQRVRPNTM